jgi:hypothetical protein
MGGVGGEGIDHGGCKIGWGFFSNENRSRSPWALCRVHESNMQTGMECQMIAVWGVAREVVDACSFRCHCSLVTELIDDFVRFSMALFGSTHSRSRLLMEWRGERCRLTLL